MSKLAKKPQKSQGWRIMLENYVSVATGACNRSQAEATVQLQDICQAIV